MPLLDGLLPIAASDLLAARQQMAFTLAFHIVLACLGIAFPAIILIAHWRGLKRGDADAMRLAQRWSKVMGVTFAVGAVTGTVLSFEMGLLWPGLMEQWGEVFGVAFAIEGIFFFCEAIFLAVYIYGWNRIRGWAHWAAGLPMVIAGIGGSASVVAANSWMNQPQGFTLGAGGSVVDVDPVEVLLNPATAYEVPHMYLAAFMVTGFLVASVYAVAMLKGRRDRHHRLGLTIPLAVACIAAPIQIFVGDLAARGVAGDQPAKFAAMECIYETGPNQPERIGGVCTSEGVEGGVSIPDLNSLLVGWSADTVVTGLDDIPEDEHPPALTLLHLSFDLMVGIGFALLALAAWFALGWWRRREPPTSTWFLRAVSASGVAAILAMWAGWIVTEVGRQPWIVYEQMRTEDAVTEAGGIWFTFGAVVALYAALGTALVLVLRYMARRWREREGDGDPAVPYGPPDPGRDTEPPGGEQ